LAKKKRKLKHDANWAEAIRRCRLNQEDVRMAKELGLEPRKLIKNIPSPSERWKQPVKFWIRELYARRRGSTPAEQPAPQEEPAPFLDLSLPLLPPDEPDFDPFEPDQEE
jgi:hypothetical protein